MKSIGLGVLAAAVGEPSKPDARGRQTPSDDRLAFRDALRTPGRGAKAAIGMERRANREADEAPMPNAPLASRFERLFATAGDGATMRMPKAEGVAQMARAERGADRRTAVIADPQSPKIDDPAAPPPETVEPDAPSEHVRLPERATGPDEKQPLPPHSMGRIAAPTANDVSRVAASASAPADDDAEAAMPAEDQPEEPRPEQAILAALLAVATPAQLAQRPTGGHLNEELRETLQADEAADGDIADLPPQPAPVPAAEAQADDAAQRQPVKGDGGHAALREAAPQKSDAAAAERESSTAPDLAPPRVAVIERPSPATPLPQLSPPALAVVAGVAADADWAAYARPVAGADAAPATAEGKPVGDLRIQLQPIELGTVTAKMRIEGGRLTVEIEVESAEALHRLNSDRDAIERALRSVGMDVREVTVQQAQTAGQPGSGNPNAGGAPREGQSFFAQNGNAGQPGGNGANGSGGEGGRFGSASEGEANGRVSGSAEGDASRRGVYI